MIYEICVGIGFIVCVLKFFSSVDSVTPEWYVVRREQFPNEFDNDGNWLGKNWLGAK